jgi:hypothetical protein
LYCLFWFTAILDMPKGKPPLKPLRGFNFGLVNEPLEGIYINVDRDLGHRISKSKHPSMADEERCLGLMRTMLRFTWNAFRSVAYLAADIPEDPQRKKTYILSVPNINRQILDLLFSIAYMMDDLPLRSLEYQRAGWRELLDDYTLHKNTFSGDAEWRPHFDDVEATLVSIVKLYGITLEQQANPKLVPYWPTPTQMMKRQTPCRPFLRYLEKWLYRDTSAQTHLSFAGLFRTALFLPAEIEVPEDRRSDRERALHIYRFQQISRIAILFLAVATEIDRYFRLNNNSAIDKVWHIFSESVPEAKEMFELRYAKGS